MRRIRDRPCRLGQLPAFNTAAGEKINADRHLCRLPGPGVAAMVKAAVNNIESNPRAALPNSAAPARSSAWSALSSPWSAALRSRPTPAGRPSRATPSPCTAPRPCRPISPICPMPIPTAPKGGRLVQGVLGTFDSLNPLIVRGLAVQQVRGFVVESLMARGNDEAFTLYGLLAKSVETDDSQELRHLPSRSQGALLRRQAGARRGRAVFVGPARATRAAPTIASIIRKSPRPKHRTRSPCGSTSPAPTTANCR